MAEKKFRTAMNGYNKDDVHHYIEELAVEAEQKLLQKEEHIKKMEHELAKIRNEIMQYKNDAEQAHKESDELRETLDKTQSEIGGLQQELARMTVEAQEKTDELQAAEQLNEENQRLQARVQQLEEERDKIPAALIVAQRQADEIIQASKEKMLQYETEVKDRVSAAYQDSMDKMKQLKIRVDGSASLLSDLENQVRLATSKFVQTMEQSKRETAELAKALEAAQQEHQNIKK